jgi:transglutaminase-like putative cysteine protease
MSALAPPPDRPHWRWQGPRAPSREARDTLFMLAVIGWTVAPHALRLSPWVGLLCAAVLAWRAALAWQQAPLPGRWTVSLVLLAAAGLTWWTERTLLGREAGVTLLVVLMALKTLELRARRDALVVFFLGFFLVLTNFLYSQTAWTAVAMALSVWGWLTALTLAHMPAGRPQLREAGALAARAALLGTPVMVLLFALFPRIGPLWSLPQDVGVSGLSGELRMGQMAELVSDDSIAFRLRFDGPGLPPQALYFRGPVLTRYDGEVWRAEPGAFKPGRASPFDEIEARPLDLQVAGPLVRYEMTLEPLHLTWLPLLEITPNRPQVEPPLDGLADTLDAQLQWRTRFPLSQRLHLTAQAWPRFTADQDLPLAAQRADTALPAGRHPRTRAWARALHAQPTMQHADAGTLANAVLDHIRQGGYTYTLTPGAYEGDNVDEFWLDRKAGFCEHFASAFVVVMRAMGVPARLVTGYQGSDPLPVDGQLIVRQSFAHAWAEYWLAGVGWVRADPTAAVAPDRIQRSRELKARSGLVMSAIDAVSPNLRLRLRHWAETLDGQWNQWVLNYSRGQQLDLLRNLGVDAPDGADLGRMLVMLLAGLGLAGAAWAWFDARRQTPWQRLQQRVAGCLARWNVQIAPHESPSAWARHVRAELGAQAEPLAQALQALEQHRYAPGAPTQVPAAWWRDFRQRVKALARRRTADAAPG